MTVRKLARLGEPILREPAAPVTDWDKPRLQRLVADLVDTLRANDGAGLAAPQIFESVQVCVIEVRSNPRYPAFPEIPLVVLVNPVITPLVSTEDAANCVRIYEGCLSVPGLRGQVTRPRRVRVQAQDLDGRSLDQEWVGIAAAIVQHEVDHLMGTLFVDRADTRTLCFSEPFQAHVPEAMRVWDGGTTC